MSFRIRMSVAFVVLNLLLLPHNSQAQQSPEQRARDLKAIQSLGGVVEFDESHPDRPVIRVDLRGPRVNDATLRHVRGFIYLRSLCLCGTKVTDAGLAELRLLENLEVLYLTYTRVSDRGLEVISGHTKLRELGLSFTDVSDQGLRHLSNLVQLRSLALSNTLVSDDGLAAFGKLSRLNTLYLNNTRITQQGLEQLTSLPLQTFSCEGTRAIGLSQTSTLKVSRLP